MNTDQIIKDAIRFTLQRNPDIKQSDILVLALYNILKAMFIDNKKHIILSAPTGTGKSVIGYMLYYCFNYVQQRQKSQLTKVQFESNFNVYNDVGGNSYTLTSSKMLQNQIDGDIDRFKFGNDFAILKGVRNYECTKLTNETGQYHNYSERFCTGMSKDQLEMLECYNTCPYIQARMKAAESSNTVLNYAYWLNVLKSKYGYFHERDLTIADEAHLVPDIIASNFNLEITQLDLVRIQNLFNSIVVNFGKTFQQEFPEIYNSWQADLGACFKFFIEPLNGRTKGAVLEKLTTYFALYAQLIKSLDNIFALLKKNSTFEQMYKKQITNLVDKLEYEVTSDFIKEMTHRLDDLFFESAEVSIQHFDKDMGGLRVGKYRLYKHNFYDLNESVMCRKYFFEKTDYGLYMSATLGNIDEFALLMGLNKGEYVGFRLPSVFDFSKSPIFLVNSGYLNYNNFSNNIDKALMDTLKICDNYHPNDKGIIHTSTFNIARLLKEKLILSKNSKRFLFYENAEEKESAVELMRTSKVPHILVGPSLYEGLDLKDDLGRFNILIKAPYPALTDYIKEKMKRYPFWYNRIVLEKIEQSIGRTNRHVNDYSTTYLIDSGLERLIWQLPDFITKRIKYFKVY